jgi:ribosome-interacting GTPase 1
MPTNLPPEYFAAEKKYREAQTTTEKIAGLEELIGTIPKHKGTDKLRAELRRKLSKLRSESQKKKGAAHQVSAFQIEREGAGRVVVLGAANVGKSALVNALTHATPQVSASPYTTWSPTPGMMPVKDIQVQLIDTPPLSEDYIEPELFDLVYSADLMLLMVDLQAFPIQQFDKSLAILEAHNIVPLELRSQYGEDSRRYFLSLLVAVNKCDDASFDEDFEIFCQLLEKEWPLLPVSTATRRNLEQLGEIIFEKLEIIRVYSKPPGDDPDLSQPFVLKKGATMEEFAAKVHKDFLENLKSARVWGSGVFEGQMVKRDHILQDGDIVELHI